MSWLFYARLIVRKLKAGRRAAQPSVDEPCAVVFDVAFLMYNFILSLVRQRHMILNLKFSEASAKLSCIVETTHQSMCRVVITTRVHFSKQLGPVSCRVPALRT